MNGLLASRGDGSEESPSVEDPLDEIGLAPGGFELRLAVSPRDGLEFHTPGSNTTPHGRHELAVAAIEPVGDPHEGGQLLDDRPGVRVQALPVFMRLPRTLPLV